MIVPTGTTQVLTHNSEQRATVVDADLPLSVLFEFTVFLSYNNQL